MAKGDSVEVRVRGDDATHLLKAAQNGRKVNYTFEKDGNIVWLVVQEVTRGGTVIDEGRFPASEVTTIRRQAKEI